MRATVLNLASSPRLANASVVTRGTRPPRGAFAQGAVLAPPGLDVGPDPTGGLTIRSTAEVPRAWVSPGGGRGGMRFGLVAGTTYSASVELRLPSRLTGAPSADQLRLDVWAEHASGTARLVRSHRAAAETGVRRVATTFHVPEDALGTWIRVLGGATAGDEVVADRLSITATPRPVPYYDGDTPADRWYTYAWTAEPFRSQSVRTMRPVTDSFPPGTPSEEVGDELVRRLDGLLLAESEQLLDHLGQLAPGSAIHAACRLLADEARALEPLVLGDPELRGDEANAVRRRVTGELEGLAAAQDDPDADWVRLQAARRLVGLRIPKVDATRIAGLLGPVVERPGADVEASYLLGRALERADPARSRDLVRAVAARDAAPFDVVASAKAETERFLGRRQTGHFVAEHLDTIRQRAADAEELVDASLGEAPVFMYWDEGFAGAPPLVQLCRDALLRHHDLSQVHLLDERLVPYYSDLPDRILSGTSGSRAHYAGALRLDLLLRYGGYWVDATCLTTAPLTDSFPLSAETVGVARFPGRFSSWFLGARPGSYLVRMLRSAIWVWFEQRQDLVDYFLLPSLFEMLYRLDDHFRAEWDAADAPDAADYHALQHAMLLPGTAPRLGDLLSGAPLHKLAFRYDPSRVPLDSALARLLRERGRGIPAPG